MARNYDTFGSSGTNNSNNNSSNSGGNGIEADGIVVAMPPATKMTAATGAEKQREEEERRRTIAKSTKIIAHRGLTTLPEFSVSSHSTKKPKPLAPTPSSRILKHPHPENSLAAIFYTLHANPTLAALELDVHLSSDAVPVLSHDASLRRVVGDKRRIKEVKAQELERLGVVGLEKALRAVKNGGADGAKRVSEAHRNGEQSVLLMRDGYVEGEQEEEEEEQAELAAAKWEEKEILLDIKIWNPVPEVVEKVAEVVRRIASDGDMDDAANGNSKWRKRIKMGVWTLKFAHACVEQDLPIFHISRSIKLSQQFLTLPNITGFNLHWSAAATKAGRRFLQEARQRGLDVWVWTVNDVEVMKWAIADPLITGVCTDDPEGAERLRDEYERGLWQEEEWSRRLWVKWWIWCGLNWLVGWLFKRLFKDKH